MEWPKKLGPNVFDAIMKDKRLPVQIEPYLMTELNIRAPNDKSPPLDHFRLKRLDNENSRPRTIIRVRFGIFRDFISRSKNNLRWNARIRRTFIIDIWQIFFMQERRWWNEKSIEFIAQRFYEQKLHN